MSNQPSFHCIANLGDATPIEYGGAFLLVDRLGNYCPELWIIEPWSAECAVNEPDCPDSWGQLSRVSIEPLHRIGADKVGDNCYHVDSPAWFGTAENVAALASFTGHAVDDMVQAMVSSGVVTRARAYLEMVGYWGSVEFDGCRDVISRSRAAQLCRRAERDLRRLGKLPEGWR